MTDDFGQRPHEIFTWSIFDIDIVDKIDEN